MNEMKMKWEAKSKQSGVCVCVRCSVSGSIFDNSASSINVFIWERPVLPFFWRQ